MLALHLLQSALVHVNTLLLQQVLTTRLADPAHRRRPPGADPAVLVARPALRRASACDMDSHLDLDPRPEQHDRRRPSGSA